MASDSEKLLTKATLNVARALGLGKQEIAAVTGISAEQLERLDCDELVFHPGTEAGQRCMLLLRMYTALGPKVGENSEHVRQWLRSYNSAIGEIPLAAISTYAGLIKVVVYLEQNLEGGS
jgi:hypothetical protein